MALHILQHGLALLLTCLSLAVTAQEAPPQREISLPENTLRRDPTLPTWVQPTGDVPAGRTKVPALVRLADTQVRVDEQSAHIHRIFEANDSSSLATLGQYDISFHPGYQRVTLHTLRVLRGSQVLDKLQDATIRFMQIERDANNSIFTGTVSAVLIVGDLRVGDSLEVRYTVHGENPVFAGHYFDAGSWDSTAPILRRRYIVDAPVARKLNYRFLGPQAETPQVKPEVSISNGRRIMRFESRELAAIDSEQYVPSDVHALRWLQLSEFSDWREVVRWAGDLFRAQPLGREFAPILASIREGRTPEQRIMRALAFVQNEIRYVSIAIGENSHRPAAPAEVLARRYGDCKDKSLLLVMLLRELGIEANPVLVSTEFRRNLDGFLPSPYAFNHAIVQVQHGGRSHFLDPTLSEQYGSLDVIGDAHPETRVLVVAPGSTQLTSTAPVRPALVRSLRRETVTLPKLDAPARMDMHIEFYGLDAERFRQTLKRMSAEQLRKFYVGYLDRRYNAAELIGDPQFDDDRQQNRFTVSLQYRIANFIEAGKDEWSLRYQATNLTEQFFVPPNARRELPLALPAWPFSGRYEFILSLPAEFDARRRPFEKSVEGEGFRMRQKLTMSGREIRAEVELDITADRVPAARTAAFLDSMRATSPLLGGSFTVDRDDMKRADAPQLPFKESVAQRIDSILARANSQIDSARQSGRDASAALCERAQAYAWRGATQPALADAEAAARSSPGVADMQYCLGSVQFMVGALPSSFVAFSRAIAQGLDDFDSRFSRGLVQHYQRRYREAAADFEQAARLGSNATQRARADYWRMLSQRRAGQTPTAGSGPHTSWPGAALGLFDGSETPDRLLQNIMAENAGYALETVLADAYLFIAQYHALRGEGMKSRVWLRQAIDKGVIYSLTHHAALKELEP